MAMTIEEYMTSVMQRFASATTPTACTACGSWSSPCDYPRVDA